MESYITRHSFNSQPPEGGWPNHFRRPNHKARFNSQPPEGGWANPPAMGIKRIGFNSQPPEGGWCWKRRSNGYHGCFNSQPPEGGWSTSAAKITQCCSFQLTAARRRLVGDDFNGQIGIKGFQLTAARRRLAPPLKPLPNKACIALFR